MMLLELPAEIVQHVLYMLDPESFYTCLLTNKLIREHALQSKKLLLHQLAQIPGKRGAELGHSASALLRRFSKRATRNLFNGAAYMADRYLWKVSPSMNKSISCVVDWYDEHHCNLSPPGQDLEDRLKSFTNSQGRNLWLIEAHTGTGILRIRSLEGKFGRDGQPKLLHVIYPHTVSRYLPDYHPHSEGCYKIIKVAWQGACGCRSQPILAVLLRLDCEPCTDMTLLVISLDWDLGPRVSAEYNIQPPSKGNTVAAMAVNVGGKPIIAWHLGRYGYAFVSYQNISDGAGSPRCVTRTVDTGHYIHCIIYPDRIADMRVIGTKALFYPATIPMPAWVASIDSSNRWDFSSDDTDLPDQVAVFQSSMHGIPIADYHHHEIRDEELNHGEPTCVNTALKLVISRSQHHTSPLYSTCKGAYILEAVQYPEGCDEYDPRTIDIPFEHIFVARLAETPPLHNLPNIGLKVAISPRSRRIALAAWRTLRVYSFDPLAFFDPDYGHVNHPKVPGDYAYINACGWRYYSNFEVKEGSCIVLKPVDVPCTGVIHGLKWRNEDELWGLTDEGICEWNIGVWAEGRRGESEFEHAERLNLKRRARN